MFQTSLVFVSFPFTPSAFPSPPQLKLPLLPSYHRKQFKTLEWLLGYKKSSGFFFSWCLSQWSQDSRVLGEYGRQFHQGRRVRSFDTLLQYSQENLEQDLWELGSLGKMNNKLC